MTKEEYRIAIKQEMIELVKKLEIDFNEKDQLRFAFLQNQEDHKKDPLFFKERMFYDRLVVLDSIHKNRDFLPEFEEEYKKELKRYENLKNAPEDSALYKEEMTDWMKQCSSLK